MTMATMKRAAGEPEGGNAKAAKPTPPSGAEIREAVAAFATHEKFRDAVKRLLGGGFAPTDLSVLASHESLEIAGDLPAYRGTPAEALMAGLTDEVRFIDPLEVAGFSFLSGGPLAAGMAVAVGAGVGGMALKELVERFVANRHSAACSEALEAGGALLWVRVSGAAEEAKALQILADSGGSNSHVSTRPVPA
jgi:hypothetical protein